MSREPVPGDFEPEPVYHPGETKQCACGEPTRVIHGLGGVVYQPGSPEDPTLQPVDYIFCWRCGSHLWIEPVEHYKLMILDSGTWREAEPRPGLLARFGQWLIDLGTKKQAAARSGAQSNHATG